MSFKTYVESIDKYEGESSDIIVVDGRSPVVCVKHAISKLKPGGYLIFDDIYRRRYQRAEELISSDWEKEVVSGPAPHEKIKQSIFYKKPKP